VEKSLNEPLSGEEIKMILLQRIGEALDRDTTLYNDIAYAGFKANFECKISFVRSLTKPTIAWGVVEGGEDGEDDGNTAVIEEYSTDQPDVARQEHNMAIPVLSQGPAVPQRVKVRIEKSRK